VKYTGLLVVDPRLVAPLNVRRTVEPSSLNCADSNVGAGTLDSLLKTLTVLPLLYTTE
jgi:hypothetical protein